MSIHLNQFQKGLEQRDQDYDQSSSRKGNAAAYSSGPPSSSSTSEATKTSARRSSYQFPPKKSDSIYRTPYIASRLFAYQENCVVDEHDYLDEPDRLQYQNTWLKCIDNNNFISSSQEISREDAYTDAWLNYLGYESNEEGSVTPTQASVVVAANDIRQQDINEKSFVSDSSGSSHRTYATPPEYFSNVDSIIGADNKVDEERDDNGQQSLDDAWFASSSSSSVKAAAPANVFCNNTVLSDIQESPLQLFNRPSPPGSQTNVALRLNDATGGDNHHEVWPKDNGCSPSSWKMTSFDINDGASSWSPQDVTSSSVMRQERMDSDRGGPTTTTKNWKFAIAAIANFTTPQDWKAFAEQNEKKFAVVTPPSTNNTREKERAPITTTDHLKENIADQGYLKGQEDFVHSMDDHKSVGGNQEWMTQQQQAKDGAPVSTPQEDGKKQVEKQKEQEEEGKEKVSRIKYTQSYMMALRNGLQRRGSTSQVVLLAGRLVDALNVQWDHHNDTTTASSSEKATNMGICQPIRQPFGPRSRDAKGFTPSLTIMPGTDNDTKKILFIKSRIASIPGRTTRAE